MPPDEWHYPVDNSSFTNAAAQLALTLPSEIERITALSSDTTTVGPDITEPATPGLNGGVEMYVPFDEKLQYHPEFDGYEHDGQSHSPSSCSYRVKSTEYMAVFLFYASI